MRILLVNPPRSPANAIYDHAPRDVQPMVHRKLIGPPLGLLMLASVCKAEHEVALLEIKGEMDLVADAPTPEALLVHELERHRPRLVGVTFIASEHPAGMALLRAVKRFDPSIVTVAGGLHAMLCPEDFNDPAVDVLYVNQTAGTFRELVCRLERGEPLDAIGGIWTRHKEPGSALRPTSAPMPRCDLLGRDAPTVDRSFIERWKTTYRAPPTAPLGTYLFTSLGCPYRCSFCSIWPQTGGAYLQRDVESIVRELKGLDCDVVRFADANTLVDLDFAERLFARIEAEGIQKSYIMDVRADTAAHAPGLIARLARAGLKFVITGFESFRESELRGYNKKLEAERIAEAVRVFHDCGIVVRGNYVIPPDYGEADFDALAAFAEGHSVALSGYTILTPMPGTALFRTMAADIIDRDLGKYNFFNCVCRTRLPLERFYARVGELWRIRLGATVL
jgi:hopanoid C-3 methylase